MRVPWEALRAHFKKCLVEIHGADDCPAASVEDLSKRLDLASMGIVADEEKEYHCGITRKSLKLLPALSKVPLQVTGAPEDWVATLVVENARSTRMELTQANLDSLIVLE